MEDDAWGILIGAVLFIVIGAVAIVLIWQVFATWRAKAQLAREDAYRKLAERSLATEMETREDLLRISENLADLQKRMASIERVMREID
ncbi:hypothetical protein BZB76_0371 [Actinomadura pelletieri DSM 43383]|uniref:Uncharacterized protein n=1 Tax=Actinomadura pelletieri DSM 43383 TaxID=1120940 RepID=A0A495QXT0_9ACTN|nr:hypothetical protein [Actinomadura pelletieri]RKS78933.1 hypothetical protein BZB76_0371 [Actinomadura pelletieri DSM 43383]